MRWILVLALMAACGCTAAGSRRVNSDPAGQMEQARAAVLPDTSMAVAAKVQAVLEANDITVPQVAAWLFARGWQIVEAELPRVSWTPATPGSAPVAYYVLEFRIAVGTSWFDHYFPSTSGPYRMRCFAVGTDQRAGPWSDLGWSDNGTGSNALPWVAGPLIGQ